MSGTLYVVATPIGNLEDITMRAVRVLGEVDLVACEDTRHSGKLLSHFGISASLIAYHEHNEAARSSQLVEALEEGRSVALISDAGTPGISDPGYRLIRACRQAGVSVQAVPGVSAVVAALSVSGLSVVRFAFEGFLPAKRNARCSYLERVSGDERTLVFYEAPHRLVAMLEDIIGIMGAEREVVVARELTKLHEETVTGAAAEVLEQFSSRPRVRGELVVMVAPARPKGP
ncbi:MAG TPA: 16S rRNA (cytidine(1402)-2'-O)-methyltransferase, partial [Desulfuromonadales bacterium]|nr:16S rRNA (cytidine(1402)-2'-O)-methyltransferase [Desulfuromonadales bacterium]